jgi:hypothetical protein
MIIKRAAIIILCLFLSACSSTTEQGGLAPPVACQVIYDASSSGTQLYIYQQTTTGWVNHRGPGMAALADPVRGNRRKTMADADALTDTIVAALVDIRSDGPLKKNGDPKWASFDWQTQCRLDSAAVYATAGMRLAERLNPAGSEFLWEMLNQKLNVALGMAVTTRTLTGFEEGLFAWLAAREKQKDEHFGIAEMGGVSAQISFPCSDCKVSRPVIVQGSEIAMVSFSFLGMGQDEAWKNQADHTQCKRGVGLKNPGWLIADCSDDIDIPDQIGEQVRGYAKQSDVHRWLLAGAFGYSKSTDIDDFCRADIDSGYMPKTSCFRAVYQPYFLNSLGVPMGSELSGVDWTLGAAICAVSDCLAKAGPPECQWSAHGCME